MVTYFNRKDLVSFGNYLLSEERKTRKENSRDEQIRSMGSAPPIEDFLSGVSHADVENWLSDSTKQ